MNCWKLRIYLATLSFSTFNLNKKNTEVQEFRSSGVQDSPEREDLPGDRSDLTGLFLGYNPSPLS
jgi:hypothetical protein